MCMEAARGAQKPNGPEGRCTNERKEGLYRADGPSTPTSRPVGQALFTDREAPAEVGVARKTLQEWRRLGKGPKFIRISNRIFYRYSDLPDFLASCPRTVARRSRNQEGK